MLEVRCSGGKTYYQRYTDERGRERQYKIGPAAVLTLDQARRKARQIVAEALLGADPQQKRREMRAVPQLSISSHERYLPFIQTYKNSWQTDETVLRIHILPKLGALALDEIKTDAHFRSYQWHARGWLCRRNDESRHRDPALHLQSGAQVEGAWRG